MIFSVLMYDVNLNLNLNPHSEQVFLRGYQDRLYQRKMFAYGWKLTADSCFTASGFKCLMSVQEIEQKLIGLVLTQKYCYHVQRVAVLQMLHRQWPRRRIRYPVDIPWFNDRVDTLNTFLRNYFKEDRVEGVQLVYSDDRVHLNEIYGYTKYYNSVRAAVVCLLK